MSADHYQREYHLTPNGWVPGTSRYYGKIQGEEIPRPDDAVGTWLYDEKQSHSFSRPDISFTMIWQNDRVSKDTIVELRRRFSDP